MSLGVPGVNLPPIPNVDVFRSWEDWNPTPWMSGPSFPDPGDIVAVFIHYPGGGTAPRNIPEMDARMQQMHLGHLSKGWSLSYSFVVPPFGGVWEGRGVRLRNAANSGKKLGDSNNANWWSVSIQLNVTGISAATDIQCHDAAMIIQWLRDLGMQVVIGMHYQIDYTPCPGDPIIAQVEAGMLEPDYWLQEEDMAEIRRILQPPASLDRSVWPELVEYTNGTITPLITNDGIAGNDPRKEVIADSAQYLAKARACGQAKPIDS